MIGNKGFMSAGAQFDVAVGAQFPFPADMGLRSQDAPHPSNDLLQSRHGTSLARTLKTDYFLGAATRLSNKYGGFAAAIRKVDAAVTYSLTERWRLQANLENLFDTNYYLNADGNNNISPGRPRGLRLGLVARF